MKAKLNHLFISLTLGLGLTLALLCLLGVRPAPLVHAATIGVNTFADDNIVNGNCTLREAIIAANINASIDTCPAGNPGLDVITLTNGVYSLTITGADEDAAATGDLDITEDLTIVGVSSDTTIIDAASLNDRVFNTMMGTVVISGVTIRNGSDVGNGGGIFNATDLTLIHTIITGNVAISPTASFIVGGGIDNAGDLELIGSIVSHNTADGGATGGSDGGGIHSSGLLTLTNTIVRLNEASGALNRMGGGIYNDGGSIFIVGSRVLTNIATEGGGIYNSIGVINLANTIVGSNTATTVGGGIYNTGGTVTLSNSLVSLNRATGVSGGGIYNDTNSTTALAGSTVSLNTAGMDGGGIFNKEFFTLTSGNLVNNSAASGGGLYSAAGNAVAEMVDTTISGNWANDYGGGMKVTSGTVKLINVTVSDNTANSQDGGGIKAFAGSMVMLTHTTVSSNTGSGGGGSGLDNEGGTVTLKNSIIANNVAGSDCNLSGGVINSAGHNLIGDTSCNASFVATGDITNTYPWLGPLQNNGGNTETHALLSGSPAIDAGFCLAGITTDQRGQPRPNPVSPICDIGAYESAFSGLVDLVISKSVSPASAQPGQTITYTLTFSNIGGITTTGVVITDIVPAQVSGVSYQASGVTITPTASVTYSWTVQDLAANQGGVIIITGQVSATIGTVFTNTVIITGTKAETDPVNNIFDTPLTITGPITPPNSLSINGPTIGVVGISIGFDAIVTPTSTTTPVTYIWQATDQSPIMQVGSLSTTLGLTWGTTGIKVITVTATNAGGTVTRTHVITISTFSADLEVVKIDTPDPMTLGDTLHYTIIVTNNGPFIATGVVITDTLPSLSFAGADQTSPAGGLSAAATTISCGLNGNLFVCYSAVPLPPGNNLTLNLDLSPNTAGTLTNQVEVSANEPDLNPGNNTASVDTTVMAAIADLSISKTASPDPVTVGEPLTYTLNVVNGGPAPALGVTLVDPLPSGMLFGSVSTTQGTCNPANGTVTCVLNTMSNGSTVTVTIVATSTVAGIMTNTATVAASIGTDPDSNNNSATTTSTVGAITTTVNPGVDTTLVYTDAQGNPTTIFIPNGAVTETINLVYAPLAGPTSPGPPNAFAAHAFTLTSYRGVTLVPGYVFQQPLTITLNYSDADVAGLDEDTLMLYYLDTGSGTWVDAATTCIPTSTYQRFTGTNTIAIPICHLTEFALTGAGANQVYLPLILKGTGSGGLSSQSQLGSGLFENKGASNLYLPVILREE